MRQATTTGRRGQIRPGGAGSAAVFIAIVATLIIIYILFLPPEERDRILGDNGPGGQPPGPSRPGQVLLSEQVGRLDALQTRELVHSLPAFTVLTRLAAQQLKEVSSVTVSRGGFSNVPRDVTFFADPALQDNIVLSFNVLEAKGRLHISLNGQPILDREVPPGSVGPIPLASGDVQTQNTLAISVSGPGAAFWRTHRYTLANLIIAADVRDLSQAQSEVHFSMTKDELEGAERIVLSYLPRCQMSAPLYVTVNGRPLFAGSPACQVPNELDVAPDVLRAGDNALLVSASGGTFMIDQLAVRIRLAAPTYPIFYAQIPGPVADLVAAGRAQALLSLRFVEKGPVKRGTVTINGYTTSFNTAELYWLTDIGRYIVPGSNSIKVTPLSSGLDITELRVELR